MTQASEEKSVVQKELEEVAAIAIGKNHRGVVMAAEGNKIYCRYYGMGTGAAVDMLDEMRKILAEQLKGSG